jgi:hypothetical protein
MILPFITAMYQAAVPDLGPMDVQNVIADAVERARAKHADFDRFLPGVDMLSRVVFSSHREIPLDDYIEVLYCAVRHGDFTKSWRGQLKKQARDSSRANV